MKNRKLQAGACSSTQESREMKAKISENLLEEAVCCFGEAHREDVRFLALCERIAGRVVEIDFFGDNAFEAEDGTYCLPNCSWKAV